MGPIPPNIAGHIALHGAGRIRSQRRRQACFFTTKSKAEVCRMQKTARSENCSRQRIIILPVKVAKNSFSKQWQFAKMLHRRHSTVNCRITDMKLENGGRILTSRPLVCTADGRPHPAVTLSAKSLRRAWKHEIQIAHLRRRAAMARAVLPNPSAAGRMALRRQSSAPLGTCPRT